jgi:CBS domain-containing protein
MNESVTVRDAMRRDFVGASEADTVAETVELMLEEDAEAAVVLRGSDPVGLVTQGDALRAAVDAADLSTLPVSEVMDEDLERLDVTEPIASATNKMTGSPTRRLLVEDDGSFVGLLSAHDVVTAATLDAARNGADRDDVARPERSATDAVLTEPVAAGSESGSQSDQYSNQGICEICGSLTAELSTFNGQLVCSDCKNV